MISFFPTKSVTIGGTTENWCITSDNRSSTVVSENYRYKALVPPDTTVSRGDTVVCEGLSYFVVTLKKSAVNTVCKLYLSNGNASVVRVKDIYIGSKFDHKQELPLIDIQSIYYEVVTAKMQQYDLGLVPKATIRFLMKLSDDIKLEDRVKMNGSNYQVEFINKAAFDGFMWVQCSNDMRQTK